MMAVMKQDWEPEVKEALADLWELAVDLLGEDKARALFVAVTKRGRGKRGPGRNPGSPSKAAARMRQSYVPIDQRGPPIEFKVVRELTQADLSQIDADIAARLSRWNKK
jgi:hypothetical protein